MQNERHITSVFDRDLEGIQAMALKMGGLVEAALLDAALALVERGARLAVVTDGADEVAAADAETVWRLSVPRLHAVNPVGSGDSFNAGFLMTLDRGASLAEATVQGCALSRRVIAARGALVPV